MRQATLPFHREAVGGLRCGTVMLARAGMVIGCRLARCARCGPRWGTAALATAEMTMETAEGGAGGMCTVFMLSYVLSYMVDPSTVLRRYWAER